MEFVRLVSGSGSAELGLLDGCFGPELDSVFADLDPRLPVESFVLELVFAFVGLEVDLLVESVGPDLVGVAFPDPGLLSYRLFAAPPAVRLALLILGAVMIVVV